MLKTKTKEHEKVAWRVVCDPHAEEKQWLAACTVLDEQVTKQTGPAAEKSNYCSQPVAALIGIYCAMGVLFLSFGGCLSTVSLGNFAPSELQHNFDYMLLMALTLPVSGSLITGLCCNPEKRSPFLWLAPFLFFQALIAWACYAHDGLWSLLWVPFCAAMSWVSYEIGATSKLWWRQFTTKPATMFTPSIFFMSFFGTATWYAVITALTHHTASTGSTTPMEPSAAWTGFGLLGLLSVVYSFVAARQSQTKRLKTAWFAGMFGNSLLLWPGLVMMMPALLHVAGSAVGITERFAAPEIFTYGAPFLWMAAFSTIGGALGCAANIARYKKSSPTA